VRDIHVAATMLQFTTKPYGFSAYSLENLAYIMKIAGIVSGGLEAFLAKPFLWGSVCPVSPLYYNRSTTEILMRYAEYGMPVAVAPCPTSGGTSPVTLAGTLVQQNAEFLFGLVLVQIINPGTPVKYTTRPIVLEMRTAGSAFGAIEMGMMSAGIVQLAKHYGVCSDVYGLATSSKTLDEQTGFEKALNGMMPALAGANLVASVGMLEDALTSSLEQLVLDDEILGIILHAARGITVSDETLAVEAIARVGSQGDFLTDEHTARHFRRECHYPELSYRTGSPSWRKAGYQTILDAARDKARTIINEHQPKRLDAQVVDAIEQVLLDADEALGSGLVSHV
jgi:trimethylamine--corrinoid protein Co-methyltransferase